MYTIFTSLLESDRLTKQCCTNNKYYKKLWTIDKFKISLINSGVR